MFWKRKFISLYSKREVTENARKKQIKRIHSAKIAGTGS